jgi:ribosome biogenesis GTPase / thiamine phosphate phosphatase
VTDRRNKRERRDNRRGNRLRAAKADQREGRSLRVTVSATPVDIADAPVSEERGIVAEIYPGLVRILRGLELVDALPTNEILASGITFAIGDRVRYIQIGERRVIVAVEPRYSKLARIRGDRTRRSAHATEEAVLAANVDLAVIVASVASPPFHAGLIDRYLVICQNGGIRPIICTNKCDLVDTRPDLRDYQELGIPVLWTSVATGQGTAELRAALHDNVSVFTGHSGVGKSSLVNALMGREIQATKAVSAKGSMGRHTTSASRLLMVGENSFVIDTPGIRSLGFWKIDPEMLRHYFPEFQQFAARCRFRDCAHTREPGCAVRDAVAAGKLSRPRYESYARMMGAREVM